MDKLGGAEQVLRSILPDISSEAFDRLKHEGIHTALDLKRLDKEDLKELGYRMSERSRILAWSRDTAAAAEALAPQTAHFLENVTGGGRRALRRSSASTSDERVRSVPSPIFHPELLMKQRTFRGNYRTTPSNAGSLGSNLLEEVGSVATPAARSPRFVGDSSFLSVTDHEDNLVLEHLDKVEQNSEFWLKVVADAGANKLRNAVETYSVKLAENAADVSSDLRENLLEQLFDLSPEHLRKVYESVDKDSDGFIRKEGLKEGLHQCELHGLDGALDKVLQLVSGSQTGALRLAEFESMLTRLKLAQLLGSWGALCIGGIDNVNPLTVLDYNSDGFKVHTARVRDYFFGHREPEFPFRWVHLRGFDLTLLLALTIKYQLHPLTVEDVIDQCPSRMDRHGTHYFVAIELLYVTGDMTGHERIQVQGRHVTMFCAGPPKSDTMITISQPDRSFTQDWPGEVMVQSDQGDRWVQKLQKRLQQVRSRIQVKRSDFLMHEVIDLCADEFVLVTRAFSARVSFLEDRMNAGLGDSYEEKLAWFNEVSAIRLQLQVVTRRLRGLQRILRRAHDDEDLFAALRGYLNDVVDHVTEAYEDAGHLAEKCVSLTVSYEHAEDREQQQQRQDEQQLRTLQEDRMNKMLFILTVLTTIFTPLTFLAGVYGMNFQDGHGTPTIPELVWPNGYKAFWIFTIVYLLLSSILGVWLWRRLHGASASTVENNNSREGLRRATSLRLTASNPWNPVEPNGYAQMV
jgi:magnesium transporter